MADDFWRGQQDVLDEDGSRYRRRDLTLPSLARIRIATLGRCRIFLLAFLVLIPITGSADTLVGRVVRISDGDTITVLDPSNVQHRIRLAGIDAPERRQPFGDQSKQHLSSLVFGKDTVVEWRKRDRYGRIVGTVFVAPPNSQCVTASCPKTLDTSFAQLAAGMAWHYKKYAREQSPDERDRYAAAEERARHDRLGLWQDSNPMPPWEWRHR